MAFSSAPQAHLDVLERTARLLTPTVAEGASLPQPALFIPGGDAETCTPREFHSLEERRAPPSPSRSFVPHVAAPLLAERHTEMQVRGQLRHGLQLLHHMLWAAGMLGYSDNELDAVSASEAASTEQKAASDTCLRRTLVR
jgi:hypothetical protein